MEKRRSRLKKRDVWKTRNSISGIQGLIFKCFQVFLFFLVLRFQTKIQLEIQNFRTHRGNSLSSYSATDQHLLFTSFSAQRVFK